jgi:hypothetical protein
LTQHLIIRLTNFDNLDILEYFSLDDDSDYVEKLSWEVYNCLYTTDKSDSMFFRRQNRFLNSIIEELTLYERMELVRTLIVIEKRRIEIGMQPFKCGSCLYSLQSSSGAIDGSSADAIIGDLADSHQSASVSAQSANNFETTVKYIDEQPGINVAFDGIADSTFYKDHVIDSDIQKFLSRPVQIATITWLEGTPFNTTLAPWDLYFNTASVRNKLENFAWLSCTLKIKILINSSPFYYGASLVSYYPNLTLTPVGFSGGANVAEGILTRSQRPHIWIYPQCNQGGDMTLPFFNQNSWLPVGTRSAFQNMGTLLVESAVDLGSANGAVGVGVTIAIYAWADDVRLAGPTLGAALQGEFGLISTPASVVANVAKQVGAMGFMKPYARATEIAATAVGNIAKLFGFSNTPVITDVQPFKSLPFHSFASGEISQPSERLTLDPKQEVCVDSRVCGYIGKDELIISSIVEREAFVCYIPWSTSDVAGTLLAKSNVSPAIGRVNSITNTSYHNTPMGHVSSLFRYWKGDIIYIFRIIASKYHRGRLLIQWDPFADIITTPPTTNVVYSQIVDIAEAAEIEFRVPYMARNPWLDTQSHLTVNLATFTRENFLAAAGTLNTYNALFHNGRLTVRVLTALTAPIATAPVVIMGSVRGAMNLEFAGPQDPPREANYYTLQSEVVSYNTSTLCSANNEESKSDDFNDYLVTMGEKIVSLRQLMRRTNLSRTNIMGANTTAAVLYSGSVMSPLPLYKGWDANGINTATNSVPASAPYNYVQNTCINWVMSCFSAYRGSMNWHINVNSPGFVDTICCERWVNTQLVGDYYQTGLIAAGLSLSGNVRGAYLNTRASVTGRSLINQKTQTGASFNIPFYSPTRMRTTSPARVTLGHSADGSDIERVFVQVTMKPTAAATVVGSTSVEFYCSIGHDFDLIFFLNVPVLNYQSAPAAP